MMKKLSYILVAALVSLSGTVTEGQVTSNEGDHVLNAPYRGTITSLRTLCEDLAYGEVQTHCEPLSSYIHMTSNTVDIWVEGDWDRSVLRLYEGVDASGNEIDLTGTDEFNPVTVYKDADTYKRFSYKAISTRTLEPQRFTIKYFYRNDSTWQTVTRHVTVAPMTGSFAQLPGQSEAFHFGTPILDVSVGNAHLTVPTGRTAEMIGATFEDKDSALAVRRGSRFRRRSRRVGERV